MKIQDIETMNSIIKSTPEIFKYFGLEKFNITELTQEPSGFQAYFTLYKDIRFELSDLRSKNTIAIIRDAIDNQIKTPLKESQALKDITKEYTEEIYQLKQQIEELNSKIKELEPFKIHYDLELKLKHG